MKKYIHTLLLLLMFAIPVAATEITVSSSQWFQSSYRYAGTTATLRLYYSQSFLSNTNVNVVGSAVGSSGWYKSVACTISSSTLNCASFTLQSTVDSNKPNTRFFAVLYDQSGARRETLMGDASGWIVPASPTSTTVAQLQNSQGTGIPNPPTSYLNSSQVQALINTAVGTLNDATDTVKGRTKLSVPAATASNPIAVGDDDRRLGGLFNLKGYGAVCDGLTNDTAAWNAAKTAAASLFGSVYIPPSTTGCLLSTPGTVSVPILSDGGSLLLPDGGTITVTSLIVAPRSILFRNATVTHGTVSLVGNTSLIELFPEWWGAKGDFSTDCSPPTNATIAASKTLTLATSGDAGVPITFGVGQYLFNSAVTYNAANNSSIVIRGQGYSTVFIPGADITILTLNQGNSSNQGLTVSGIFFNLNLHNAAAIDLTAGGQLARFQDIWVLQPSATGNKKLISLTGEFITLDNVQISGTGTARSLTNTNVGIYINNQTSHQPYRIWLTHVQLQLLNKGFSVDTTLANGAVLSIKDSSASGCDTAVDIGGTGTGLNQIDWTISGSEFEGNTITINLNGFSGSFPLLVATIADNHFTGSITGDTVIKAKNINGLNVLRNEFKNDDSSDHGAVALSLMSGIAHARKQGNITVAGTAINMTIAGNSTASVTSGPVFQSADLSSDGTSLDTLLDSNIAPVTKTANFTWATNETYIIVNQAGTTTATLPAASSFTGRILYVKTIQAQTVVSASSNVVPLVGGAAGTAILAATAGKWAMLISDGTNWIISTAN